MNLSLAIILVLAILVLERRSIRRPTDWLRNLQATALGLGLGIYALKLPPDMLPPSLLDGRELPFLLTFALFLVVSDFGEWAFHVAQHKIPFLWRMHSLHHSDPEVSVLTTNRHFWGDRFIKSLTIYPAAFLIVRPTPEVAAAYGLAMLFHYFPHANLRIDFGRLSWVLNSPAYHRQHHSRLPEHYDTNFAGMLPIFDLIFGTYRRPTSWPPTGLETKPESMVELFAWPVLQKSTGASSAIDESSLEPRHAEQF